MYEIRRLKIYTFIYLHSADISTFISSTIIFRFNLAHVTLACIWCYATWHLKMQMNLSYRCRWRKGWKLSYKRLRCRELWSRDTWSWSDWNTSNVLLSLLIHHRSFGISCLVQTIIELLAKDYYCTQRSISQLYGSGTYYNFEGNESTRELNKNQSAHVLSSIARHL